MPEVVIIEILPGCDDGICEGVVEFICGVEELEELMELVIGLFDGLKVGYDYSGKI